MNNIEAPLTGIAKQLFKLINLSSVRTKLGCSRVNKDYKDGVNYVLLHSMTWDENGELNID